MEIHTFTKIFFINLYIFSLDLKLINKKYNFINIALSLLFSLLISRIYLLLQDNIDKLLMIVIMYVLQLIIIKYIIVKDEINTFSIVNLLSNSIVYTFFVISTVIELGIIKIFYINSGIINILLIVCIEFLILTSFMKIRKVKYGLKFLQKSRYEYFDIIIINISAVVILAYYLSGNYYGNLTKQIVIGIIILGCLMIVMIQKTLTLYYKQKLLHQTIEDYKNEIAEKDNKIKELSDEKYKISKLNHEFFNRQKALEKKVADFVSGLDTETSGEIAVGDKIASLSKEYSDKLQDIKHPDKLPSTDIEEIDDIFKYMQSECEKNKIEFKLQVNGNIHHMINKIIPKDKLVTLIGDHLRDAIIAINSSNNKFKSIFVIIGKTDLYYEFCVLDTGIEFEVATLLDLGTKPITTHKDTGGTGFGFMTTFETLKVTKGSLEIEEKHKMNENDYTKAVKIIFDDKSQYRIKSYRLGTKEKNI